MPLILGTAGGGGALTRIGSVLTGTGASGVFTFSSIPSSYNHLYLVVYARSDAATTAVNGLLAFNGVGGTSYNWNYLTFDGTTTGFSPSLGTSSITAAIFPGASGVASHMGMADILIPFYATTGGFKVVRSEHLQNQADSNAGIVRRMGIGQFLNTTAISSLTLTLSSGNYTTASKAELYGMA